MVFWINSCSSVNVSIISLNTFSDSSITLGETPANTTLTVTYRAGGGISSNVPAGDLTTLVSSTPIAVGNSATPTITNLEPARGGADEQSVEEIKR